jgi:hypothetical protein
MELGKGTLEREKEMQVWDRNRNYRSSDVQ